MGFLPTIFLLFICLKVSFSSIVKFHVFSPEELSKHYKYQTLDISVATYGYIPYGQSLIGNLYFSNPRNACMPLNSMSMNLTDPSPIIVIERGDCHFVTKSHYAQLFGAKMVIIVDNEIEKENSIMMIDDGYGFDIHIPTLMISKRDGDLIEGFMKKQMVSISFEFLLEKRENSVGLEFWMSSYDESSYEFLRTFKKFYTKLASQPNNIVSFSPHYALWICPSCKEANFTTKTDNCLSNGRYCIPDGEGSKLKMILGSDVVYEDLTQLCLYHLNMAKWWDYVEMFYDSCFQSKLVNFDLKSCSEKIYTSLDYKKSHVEMCINDSFVDKLQTNSQDGENIILSEQQKMFMTESIQTWPLIRINNETYRGNLMSIKSVITAVCQAYPTEIGPCKDELGKSISKSKGQTVTHDEGGVSTTTFVVLSVVIIIVLSVVLLFFYQRRIRREMSFDLQNKVNDHLSKYFSLGGEKKADISSAV